ncbi:phytase [Aeromicrobium sp. NPDC092404]|uniref:phytase n=1 Tax=Aeromicrobium sp. NPDC092404 TaxID=3154976 RepID=UPI00341816B2
MTSPKPALAAIALFAVPSLVVSEASAHPRPADQLVTVTAKAETPGVYDDDAGNNGDADDPAIWVNRTDKARSVIIGTAKNAGLNVYSLKGALLQSIAAPDAPRPDDEAGRFNNVDIVHGFRVGGRTVDLAVTSDRGRDTIRSYVIDRRTGRLSDVTSEQAPLAFSKDQAQVNDQETIYGLTTFQERGTTYVVGTRRHRTDVGLFKLRAVDGRVTYTKVDTLELPSSFTLPNGTTWSPCEEPGEGPQLEGVVVDEAAGTLYAAQEDIGLWRVKVKRGAFHGGPRAVERTKEFGVPATYDEQTEECVPSGADPGFGGRIAADTEGLTIYETGRRSGTLLVSSQGDDTFYTYDRQTNRPLRHFAVVDGATADGSQDCDGADTVSTPLPGYPHGLLVVQDGDNTPVEPGDDGEPRVNTNFKLLDASILRR